MKVLIDNNSRQIYSYGNLIDKDAIEIADNEVNKLFILGNKYLNSDNTIRVDPVAIVQTIDPLKQQIIQLAQSSVGITLNQLTTNQVRALLACLLYKAGGVKSDMTVDSLGNWLQ